MGKTDQIGHGVAGGPIDDIQGPTRPADDLNEKDLKMSKKNQYAIMYAAGLKPGPNVSLAYAIDIFRTRKLRESVMYLVFLFTFNVGAFIQRDVTDSHRYSQSVKNVIIARSFPTYPYYQSFENISTHEHVWLYLQEVIPQYLYAETWYNGDPYGPEEISTVMFTNRLVQAPRLRQIRRSSQNCSDLAWRLSYLNLDSRCHSGNYEGSSSADATDPIPGWPPGSFINYSSATELRQGSSSTQRGWYEGGGFIVDFPLNLTAEEVKLRMAHLKKEKWTGTETRAMFFDFALYNSAQRFFLGVRLNFEFLPTGKVQTSVSIRVMRLGFLTVGDYMSVVFDVMVYAIVLFYILEDLKKIWDGEHKYWYDAWHYLNWIMYTIFLLAFLFKIQFWLMSTEYINGEMGTDEETAALDFETLGWYYSQVWNWTSFNCIFVWFKAFSFFKYFNQRIANLAYAVLLCARELRDFLVVLFLMTFAFAIAFHTAFGIDVRENRTLPTTIFELFELFAKGNMPYDEIVRFNTYLGLFLILSFQIILSFIVIKLPAAILIRSFSNTRDKGVDDPMSKEFRAVVIKIISRAVKAVFYSGVKDEKKLFREEREKELEVALDQAAETAAAAAAVRNVDKPRTIKQTVKLIHNQSAEIGRNLATLTVSADKLFEVLAKKLKVERAGAGVGAVEAPVSLFRPPSRQAWKSPGQSGTKRAAPRHLPGTMALEGNKMVVPPDWKTFTNAEGHTYFFDTQTGQTQWDPPTILVATQLTAEEKRAARIEALGLTGLSTEAADLALTLEFEA